MTLRLVKPDYVVDRTHEPWRRRDRWKLWFGLMLTGSVLAALWVWL